MHKSIGLHCKSDAYTSKCVLTDSGENQNGRIEANSDYTFENISCATTSESSQ